MSDSFSQRQFSIRFLFVILACTLVARTFYIQLIDSTYRAKAEATTIDEQVIYPSRGIIYDRNGKLLVFNDPSYDLMVTYNQIDPDIDTAAFCDLLGIDIPYFKKALDKKWSDPRYSKSVPFPFLTNISAERFAKFEERLYQFPGFRPLLRHTRGYPHSSGAHLLGYTREVSKADIEKYDKKYSPGDYIGKSGIELAYEDTLRGEKGVRLILKDNLGRDVEAYKGGDLDRDPISGKDLFSTIDLDLQRYGEELMQNKIGSIVAIDPKTGEILAMVSTPTYNPNLLAIGKGNRNAYAELLNAPNNILFDRSVMAQYPPGSLFKPIVALIGMQTGVLQSDRTIFCSGAYYFEGMRLTGCHGHPTCFDVSMGIQHSCNAYFVTVFRDIVDSQGGVRNPEKGLDLFNSYLAKFGLGSPLGIDLPREKAGNFPTSKYYTDLFNKQQEGQRWNSIWIRSLGIGQGELLMTNLQMANVAAIIANRGHYYTPHLVKGIMGNNLGIPEEFSIKHEVDIDAQHFEHVVNGMENVVLAGTARSAYIQGISVCGKTGTAENPHGKDHVIEQHLSDSIQTNRLWLDQRMKDAVLIDNDTP